MFLLNGNPLPVDTAFTAGDIQYPANWLRLASPYDRAAIGITEVDDPIPFDDRFYWGVDNPKDLAGLKEQWTAFVSDSAWKLLQPTDYMDSRKANDPSFTPPADWITWRSSVRTKASEARNLIASALTVEALIPLTQIEWPLDPVQVSKVA